MLPWLAVAISSQTVPVKVDFAREIAPVLKSKCADCHGADVQSGGLRLDTLEGIKKGGVSGPLFVVFKSSDSLIVKRLLGADGKPRMPMGFGALPDETIAKIKAWIDQGAVMTDPSKVNHWSFKPPVRPTLPTVKDSAWPKNPIDRFVLARLEKEGLKPSPEAPKETLARRAALDLTGLPPTVEELDHFLVDKKPGAYERYVDRLLASPHYGERMARIWLDLARYADTNGYEKDLPRQMWAWRDWVINAFNTDMPYDRFTIDQLAGDLLPKPTRDQLVATGFHRNSMLNDEGGIDTEEFRVVAVMDRIDTTATTWLGSTLACAQCHDHKYDPFTQRDYYSFFAFFNRSEDNGRDTMPIIHLPNAAQEKEIDALQADIDQTKKQIAAKPTKSEADLALEESRVATGWIIVPPEAKAVGATLTVLRDNSILASGPDPIEDTYTVALPLKGIASLDGLRIEAIPDPSLPEHGSGRNFNGNFVLKHVEASLMHGSKTTPISLSNGLADFTQEGFDPQSLTGTTGPGWAIAAFQPENRVLHTVVLALAKPLVPSPEDRLVITLHHQTKYPNHNLGRFRISLTGDHDLVRQTPPTAGVRAILDKTADQRSKDESKKLRAYLLSADPEVSALQKHLAEIQKKHDALIDMTPTTMVMHDLEKPRPDHILKRGDFRTPGDPVSPATPVVMGGAAPRKDRLGLAEWLVDGKNPLTGRVEVNRLWEQCFGRGIVATPEDFGTQGDPPSHPELLDWMATELVAKKWDIKAMLRMIVTSATYRQSSKVSDELEKQDPYNILLARGPRFRVEAEMIRDIALTASGRLTPTIGGPSVMPPQPPGVWENSFSFYDTKERWKDATGPDRYRRGLYTYWRRTAPYPMELTFDLKSRDMCVAHRSRTNSPLQALNELNDPVFLECAGKLGVTISERGLAYGFRATLSRSPKAAELAAMENLRKEALVSFVKDTTAANKLLAATGIHDPKLLNPQNAAWVVVANAMLNLDETITKS